MVYPVGWAVIIVIRLLFSKKSGIERGGTRAFRVFFVKFFVVVFAMGGLVRTGFWGAPLWVLLGVYLQPGLFLERVLVPLGLPRVAYYFALIAWPLGFSDSEAVVACYYAVRALRNDTPNDRLSELQAKLSKAKRSHGGAVVALGIIALAKHQPHEARQLFYVAHSLSWHFISRATRAVARDYLVMDAVRAGAYRTALALGSAQKPRLRWSYFVARASRRLLRDAAAPSNAGLWFWWFIAPRRRQTYSLLRRALDTPRGPAATKRPRPNDLPTALASLADALRAAPRLSAERLSAIVADVDAMLDHAATRAVIERRLLGLNANEGVDSALSRFRGELVRTLVRVIQESEGLTFGIAMSPSLEGAISEARRAQFRELGALANDYRRRTVDEDGFSPDIEWKLWANFRAVAERLLRIDPTTRAEVFAAAFIPICNFAVLQHNTYKQLALAHSMYAWLHRYADASSKDAALLVKNMKAAIT